ncbi:MAG: sigma-70 family RNA polymerase sigma factor [Candidatus Dadabacteria bacterium]|nr:sigma-70 family RNA polymerase sigma factor [Candidatus Dadabacteria bacterium]
MINVNRAVNKSNMEENAPLFYRAQEIDGLGPQMKYSKDLEGINRKGSSDEELVRLFAKYRDEESFNEIVNRSSDKVYRIALKLTDNISDAEDVIQEVFILVYKKAKTFRGESRFSTWLYRLTVNVALTKLRQSKRGKEVSLDGYMPKFREDGHHLVRPVVDWSQEVDKLVLNKEFRQLIQQAMDQLQPVDRAVVVMSDLEEMSNREIGELLGLSVQAVKARLHRARLFLRGRLAIRLGYSPT